MEKKVGLFISGFVMILLGLVMFQATTDTISQTQNINTATRESVTITSGSGDLAQSTIRSLTFFGNGSNNTDDTGISIGTHANVSRNGTITVSQLYNITPDGSGCCGVVFANGVYNASYTYEGPNYIADTTNRNIAALIPVFIALAIMSIGVAMAYTSFKETFGDL